MLQTLKAAKARLGTLALTPVAAVSTYMITAKMAMAEEAENASIRGALETNQKALDVVAKSTFTEDGVKSAAQATTNALLFGAGAAGIAMAAWGIWILYKLSNEGATSKHSAVLSIAMIALGGFMTIASIITAVFPNLVLGTEAT